MSPPPVCQADHHSTLHRDTPHDEVASFSFEEETNSGEPHISSALEALEEPNLNVSEIGAECLAQSSEVVFAHEEPLGPADSVLLDLPSWPPNWKPMISPLNRVTKVTECG